MTVSLLEIVNWLDDGESKSRETGRITRRAAAHRGYNDRFAHLNSE